MNISQSEYILQEETEERSATRKTVTVRDEGLCRTPVIRVCPARKGVRLKLVRNSNRQQTRARTAASMMTMTPTTMIT